MEQLSHEEQRLVIECQAAGSARFGEQVRVDVCFQSSSPDYTAEATITRLADDKLRSSKAWLRGLGTTRLEALRKLLKRFQAARECTARRMP